MNILIKLTSIIALIIAPHITVNKPAYRADITTPATIEQAVKVDHQDKL